MKKIKCDKCDKLITSNNFKKHYDSCGNRKFNIKFSPEWLINEIECKCPYCDKIYQKKGIITHILRSHTNPELFKNCHRLDDKNYPAWNKGLTKYTDDRVKKNGESLKENIKNGNVIPYWKGKYHTNESKKLIGQKMTKNNNGGKCKWFSFIKKDGSDVKLQGTWEVRFAKVLDIIDENWIKIGVGHKGHSFIWKDNNEKEHYYTPDFFSPKLNKYFEVKGYWWGDDKNKMKQVISQNKQVKIEIIMKNELVNYEKLLI